MGVSYLERAAFEQSDTFRRQIEHLYLQEVLTEIETLAAIPTPTDAQKNRLALYKQQAVGRLPVEQMIRVLVSNSAWSVGYSTWAEDPAVQETLLRQGIKKYMPHLL